MISKTEITASKYLPCTLTQLANKLAISPSAAFKITEKLITNGLATKKRTGKTVHVIQEKTIHATELKELQQTYPRLPLEKILSHTKPLILSLLDYPLTHHEIQTILNQTRQWTSQQLTYLSHQSILIKKNKDYQINPLHMKIHQFATHYNQYINQQTIQKLANDAQILWQHGNEILIQTKKELTNYPATAVTTFGSYKLPLIGDIKYYFITHRTLQINDIILHTLLINPHSKTYNAYACLLYDKTKPSNIHLTARLYNLTPHIKEITTFIETHTTESNYLPTWNEYLTLAQEYGVR